MVVAQLRVTLFHVISSLYMGKDPQHYYAASGENWDFGLLSFLTVWADSPKTVFLFHKHEGCNKWYSSCLWHENQFFWAIAYFGYFIIVNAWKLHLHRNNVVAGNLYTCNNILNGVPWNCSFRKLQFWSIYNYNLTKIWIGSEKF